MIAISQNNTHSAEKRSPKTKPKLEKLSFMWNLSTKLYWALNSLVYKRTLSLSLFCLTRKCMHSHSNAGGVTHTNSHILINLSTEYRPIPVLNKKQWERFHLSISFFWIENDLFIWRLRKWNSPPNVVNFIHRGSLIFLDFNYDFPFTSTSIHCRLSWII